MKSDNQGLEILACRLRRSVEEGRYGDSQRALAEYAGALRQMAAGLSPDDPALQQLEEECLSLLEQSRRQVLVRRAHAGVKWRSWSGMPGCPSLTATVFRPGPTGSGRRATGNRQE